MLNGAGRAQCKYIKKKLKRIVCVVLQSLFQVFKNWLKRISALTAVVLFQISGLSVSVTVCRPDYRSIAVSVPDYWPVSVCLLYYQCTHGLNINVYGYKPLELDLREGCSKPVDYV